MQQEIQPQLRPTMDIQTGNIEFSVVIPVFNEESNITELFQQLTEALAFVNRNFEIIFVNDGSTDNSYQLLSYLHEAHPKQVKVVNFSRNFGHQLAITAGLKFCQGRAAIVMDADLQDPPEVIVEFLKKWDEGYDIVYGKRTVRQGETLFKKFTANLFYKLIRMVTTIEIKENVGDFYLLDRKILNVLDTLNERHRFVRGLVAWVGYRHTEIEYTRRARYSGETKYGFWKMIKFSLDAMTSFSFAPLRFVSWLGTFFSVISFFSILLIIYMRLFTSVTIVGWSSIMAVVLFVGGIQLLALGIIGEYIARIGDDVKSRPLYNVSNFLG
tara:strand:+ start:330 stop:1310 length:981 start_codon:yes stop_codon:yes gene_type:complete